MICFDKVSVSGEYSVDFLLIEFTIKDTTEDIATYKFDLFRSNDWNSGFQMCSQDIQNFEYQDYDINLKNPSVLYCYKIQATNKETGETLFSKVFAYRGGTHGRVMGINIMHYIQWSENKYLDVVIDNNRYFLLRRIRSGSVCPDCYDDIRKSSRISRCKRCFGVGYSNGYFEPVPICINFDTTVNSSELLNQGTIVNQDSPLQAWTSSYPRIQVGDVIIGSKFDNQRYKVMNVNMSRREQYISRQIFSMQAFPPSDIIYDFPVREYCPEEEGCVHDYCFKHHRHGV